MTEIELNPLAEPLGRIRTFVDEQLDRYTQLPSDCPARLAEAMRYGLLAPGKRLRPSLVILAAEAVGGAAQAALPAACAVEMIHAYSLIHDDLPAMDDDDLRRGRPTCHKAFDEATAILAGDGLLTLAFDVLAREVQPAAVAAQCCAELAAAAGACGMVGGQGDDLDCQFTAGTVETLEHIHRRKTGAMIRVSVRLGALVAGATDQQMAALETYGASIGLAFQIIDDLLDEAGDEQAMGKRVGKDRGRGKLTFPSLLGAEESSRRATALVAAACDAIAAADLADEHLAALARYVLERNH
ncbi:MAG: polyprenyl synthetase family protein [Planctomycetales bacterium]|nr:polyprenyl synthetase family protein [Planctomycetales bacterium]